MIIYHFYYLGLQARPFLDSSHPDHCAQALAGVHRRETGHFWCGSGKRLFKLNNIDYFSIAWYSEGAIHWQTHIWQCIQEWKKWCCSSSNGLHVGYSPQRRKVSAEPLICDCRQAHMVDSASAKMDKASTPSPSKSVCSILDSEDLEVPDSDLEDELELPALVPEDIDLPLRVSKKVRVD